MQTHIQKTLFLLQAYFESKETVEEPHATDLNSADQAVNQQLYGTLDYQPLAAAQPICQMDGRLAYYQRIIAERPFYRLIEQ